MAEDPSTAEAPLLPPLLPEGPEEPPEAIGCRRAALVRKVQARLLAVCCLVMFLCYVDRTNLGLAASDFIRDLGIDQTVYGTGVGMFYVGYVLFQAPSNLVLERLGAPLWLGLMLIFWGVASTLTAFVRTPLEFYAARLVLGMSEAGTLPGLWYYLTLFLPEDELTFPLAAIDSMAVISQVVAAPMAAGFLCLDNVLGLKGWQWMFLAQGLPPVVLGAAVMWALPREPSHARFLSRGEADWLCGEIQRLRKRSQQAPGESSKMGVWAKVVDVLWRRGFWVGSLTALLRNFSYCILYYWTVLLIQSLIDGHGLRPCLGPAASCTTHTDSKKVVLLTDVPYTLTAVSTLIIGWRSDRCGERRWHISLPYILGAAMFALLPVMSHVSLWLGFCLLVLGMMGSIGGGPPMNSLVASQMSLASRAVGLGIFNSVANLSGFLGPILTGVLVDTTHSYKLAIWLVLALPLFLSGLTVLLMDDPIHRGRSISCADH